jgi:uncharacterized surface protein with fasciclin (FAS1) repeats/uncharacterized protein YgiM (DUF1202 family)
MKKILSIALLVALMAVAVVPTTVLAQDGDDEPLIVLQGQVLTNSAVAVRAEASISSETVATLESGATVDVVEEGDLFTQIRFEDADGNTVEGFVFTDNLAISPAPLQLTGTVATNNQLGVRAEPSISADVLTNVSPGDTVGVLTIATDGIWAEIFTDEVTGWVFANELSLAPDSTAAADFLTDGVRFVTNSQVALRAEPEIAGEVIETYESGTTALRLFEDEAGVFSFVVLDDGTRGWVFSDNVRVDRQQAVGTGVTTEARVLFRSSPEAGSTENIIRPLNEGEELLILGVTDDNLFFEARAGEDTGFVSTSFVETDAFDLTIAGIAASNPDFSTLMTAVGAADPAVAEALAGEGPLTVFAPTNAAFEALGEETLNAVLADQEQLTNILLYHVVSGNVLAADVVALAGDAGEATVDSLLEGDQLLITVEDGNVFIDGVQVIVTDIRATNGVIHVIEGVLLPDGE